MTMMIQLSRAAALMGLATLLGAHAASRPEVPDAIKAPSAEAIVLLALHRGLLLLRAREITDAGKHSPVNQDARYFQMALRCEVYSMG